MLEDDILNKLTLEDKACLTVGKDFWHTNSFLEFDSLMLTDGPHGLRKQVGKADHLGLNESIKATCFPTASGMASSFNEELCYRVGQAIAKECHNASVDVLLGPGVNIKRHPLCGRNFEYYSEDPLVSGLMASAFINGVQSLGIATSIKHFACNNQEYARMINNSIVDERALHEIYLKAFEIAIKRSNPKTVMCSYNKINGVYASENEYLMKQVLREDFKYDGLVISDWGAINDKLASIKARVGLEMPSRLTACDVIEAVNNKILDIKDLDTAVKDIIRLYLWRMKYPFKNYDVSSNHEIAYHAAIESMVLLKNEDKILPLNINEELLIMGNFNISIQGSGSSRVNPIITNTIFDQLNKRNIKYRICKSIDETIDKKVVYFIGIEKETEGSDRKDLKLSSNQLKELEDIISRTKDIIVVLTSGSVVELPFIDSIKGLILTNLSGEASNEAIIDILFNFANPSGHLAETWPKKLEDVPVKDFAGDIYNTVYLESLFVGYRGYDKANTKPLFSFGHGLSYTDFTVNDFKIIDNKLNINIKNTGPYKGMATIFVFVSDKNNKMLRPIKELKAFKKISLNSNEETTIFIDIDDSFFQYYDEKEKCFKVSGGNYKFLIGLDSVNLLEMNYYVKEKEFEEENIYLKKNLKDINIDDFKTIYKGQIPEAKSQKPYTLNTPIIALRKNVIGKFIIWFGGIAIKKRSASESEYEMSKATFLSGPIRMMGMGINKTNYQLEGIVKLLNGKIIKGLIQFIKKDKRVKN